MDIARYQRRSDKMMRNLIVLGCAGLLAIGLSISSFAGVDPDTDSDGVTDSNDNCLVYPNGPALQDPGTPLCDDQEDGGLDGYGNPCDSDINGNGAADLGDVSTVLAAAVAVSTVLENDLNCNGAADLTDVSRALAHAAAVLVPGPSGLACAGTAPCP
jgi:hypothetical protein